jgi:hypothetical protein
MRSHRYVVNDSQMVGLEDNFTGQMTPNTCVPLPLISEFVYPDTSRECCSIFEKLIVVKQQEGFTYNSELLCERRVECERFGRS